MPLNDKELLYVYNDLHHVFREDLHLARPLIQMLQKQGNDEQARQLAMSMARTMLAIGLPSHALGFLELCKRLNHPQTDHIASMVSMAQMTLNSKHEHIQKSFTLIERLSDAEALDFIQKSNLVHYKAGQHIVEQGQISDNFYLILEGEVSVHIHADDHHEQEITLSTLSEGAYFGEYACVYQLPRSATVTSNAASVLLEFSKHSVSELMQQSPEAGEQLVQMVQQRMIQSLSRTHPAFADLAEGDRHWISDEAHIIELEPGAKFNNNLNDKCYIIIYGSLNARHQVEGQEKHCKLETHAMFGDIHPYLKLPENTLITAHERCLICSVPANIFQSFVTVYSSFENALKPYGQRHCHALEDT